ncbi:MAG TPA: NDP-sugar synthase [Pyrinomonadaceae bacterium]|nr:NDP-sugar synthase [Pyrinomonadaceae bacterium]
MKAMILSAGYGTRLWPLTEDRTKPAIPILGKPLVGYVAEYLASFGVDEIVVNLHHRPNSVREALGDGQRFGVKLHYVEEPVILGTSGALDNARHYLEDDTFIVINGKIITDINLTNAIRSHQSLNALATLVLLTNSRYERFSIVETKDGCVTRFGGMPVAGGECPPLMFTGIQILNPRIFDYIPRGVFSHSVTDVYPKAISNGEIVAAHVAEGKWRELSTLQRYLDISVEMLREQGLAFSAGKGLQMAATATVSESILWNNVTVDEGANVERAVLADNVHILQNDTIRNAVVVPRKLIEAAVPPEKAQKGFFQGESFVVPLSG